MTLFKPPVRWPREGHSRVAVLVIQYFDALVLAVVAKLKGVIYQLRFRFQLHGVGREPAEQYRHENEPGQMLHVAPPSIPGSIGSLLFMAWPSAVGNVLFYKWAFHEGIGAAL